MYRTIPIIMYKVTAFFLLGLFALTYGFPTEKEVNTWRIVGGSNATEGEVPYQVSLKRADGGHFCGGSLITTRTVVTAAHCIHHRSASHVLVALGTIFLSTPSVTFVKRLIIHPNFDYDQLSNDVGVVILSSNVTLGSTVALIPLGTSNVGGGVSALLTGWGALSHVGLRPNNLRKLVVNTITVDSCRSAHSGVGPVFDTQLCTSTRRAGQGGCTGDEGGPLVAYGQLIGIYSWGYPCAMGYPDVYVRVSSYYSWIQANSE